MGCMADLGARVLFTLLFDKCVFLKGMMENAEKEIHIGRTNRHQMALLPNDIPELVY
jgi:hypothetical protein